MYNRVTKLAACIPFKQLLVSIAVLKSEVVTSNGDRYLEVFCVPTVESNLAEKAALISKNHFKKQDALCGHREIINLGTFLWTV